MDPSFGCFRSAGAKPPTCYQCRSRKVGFSGRVEGTVIGCMLTRYFQVKCDGKVGVCSNCERLGFTCSFSFLEEGEHDVHKTPSESRPKRQRGRRACQLCRQQKVRCSGNLPSCSNCRRRGTESECSYPTPKRALRAPTPEGSGSSHGSSSSFGAMGMQPDRSATVESLREHLPGLIDSFFDRVYPVPSFAFLHPTSIKDKCINGKLELPLATAICGLAVLRTAGAECSRQDKGLSWVQFAEQAVWQEFESLTIPLLQALILIIQYRIETGRFQRAFMLMALAGRSAAVMRLNHEHPTLGFTAQEVRRRIMWSLKILERYFSIGLPEFELFPFETIYVQPPCREEEFSTGSSDLSTQAPSDCGSYNLCIKLESVRRDIMKLTRNISLCDQPYPQLPRLIENVEAELASVKDLMPFMSGHTPSEEVHWLQTKWVPRYIHMYLSWHQCHTDLYRLLLPKYQEAAPDVVLDSLDPSYGTAAEKICLEHASSVVRILANLNMESATAHLLEFDTAICAYHATRVILFISRHGRRAERPSPEFAVSRAELCIAALKRFFSGSILVKPIIAEMETLLSEFHSAGSRQDGDLSPSAADGRRDPTRQLSSAAKIRQRLAIHSLLRQADFSENHGDESQELNEPSASSPTESLRLSHDFLPSPVLEINKQPQASATQKWYPISITASDWMLSD
jgi:hypothetical protein